MKFFEPCPSSVLPAFALLLVSGAALADVGFTQAEALRRSGEALPQARVVDIVNKVRPGEITDLELDRDGGRLVYEVEISDAQGQQWDVELDAKTGTVLGEQQDD